MTLDELISLCHAFRDLGSAAVDSLTDNEPGFQDRNLTGDIQDAHNWLLLAEACSGDDETLSDEVGGTLQRLRTAIRYWEGKS